MSKGTRFLRLAIPTVILYFLALWHILPVPIVSTEVLDLVLPVVSHYFLSISSSSPLGTSYCFLVIPDAPRAGLTTVRSSPGGFSSRLAPTPSHLLVSDSYDSTIHPKRTKAC